MCAPWDIRVIPALGQRGTAPEGELLVVDHTKLKRVSCRAEADGICPDRRFHRRLESMKNESAARIRDPVQKHFKSPLKFA
jgi:hypothetical protein